MLRIAVIVALLVIAWLLVKYLPAQHQKKFGFGLVFAALVAISGFMASELML